eukprot:scaffold8738_cov146-Isochrysis_galbana.AAC.1
MAANGARQPASPVPPFIPYQGHLMPSGPPGGLCCPRLSSSTSSSLDWWGHGPSSASSLSPS